MRIKSRIVQNANPSIEFTPLLAKFGRIQGGLARQINIIISFYLQRIQNTSLLILRAYDKSR